MNPSPSTWIDYWDRDRLFRPIMKSMTQYFFERSKAVLTYDRNDVVLDIGCGPGYLEECLNGIVREIHGVDTSTKVIEECRRRFRDTGNVFFHTLNPDNYTDFTFLEGIHFTLAVCLSVIQYYRRPEDVATMIRNVKRVSAPGIRLLIADIPVHNNVISDSFELLRGAAAQKILGKAIRFLFLSARSEYRQLRAVQSLLCFPISKLHKLSEDLDLEICWVKKPLTFNRRRVNLLIRMDG